MDGIEIVNKCRWVVILIASNQITQGGVNTDIPYFVVTCHCVHIQLCQILKRIYYMSAPDEICGKQCYLARHMDYYITQQIYVSYPK